jgi:hypothetical protein
VRVEACGERGAFSCGGVCGMRDVREARVRVRSEGGLQRGEHCLQERVHRRGGLRPLLARQMYVRHSFLFFFFLRNAKDKPAKLQCHAVM